MRADFHPKAKVGPVVDILDEAHKAIADFLYRGLIGNTPVRTGRLAGGWTFSEIEGKVKTSTETILPLKDKKKGSRGRTNKYKIFPPEEKLLLDKYPKGVQITIANNVDYSEVLNNQRSFTETAFAELMAVASQYGVKVKVL